MVNKNMGMRRALLSGAAVCSLFVGGLFPVVTFAQDASDGQDVSQSVPVGQLGMVAGLQKRIMVLSKERDALAEELENLSQEQAGDGSALSALELENQKLRDALAQSQEKEALFSAIEDEPLVDERYAQQVQVIDALAYENAVLKERLNQVLASRSVTDGEAVDMAQRAGVVAVIEGGAGEALDSVSDTSVGGDISQAQKQEMFMKDVVKEGVPLAEKPQIVSEELQPPETPLEVRQAVDATLGFEEISLEDEPRAEQNVLSSSSSVAAVAAGGYQPEFSVPDLLAVVSPGAAPRLIEDVSGAQVAVYQWNSDGIYGSSEQRPLEIEGDYQFDVLAQEYLERTEERCPGAFAVVLEDTFEGAGGRVDSYDVACVGDDVSSSAALLFYGRDGGLSVLAHEVPTERLEEAIERRERVVSAIVHGG